MSRLLRRGADAFVIVAVFALGYLINDLEDGLTEIGRHWWSSIALVATGLSIGVRTAVGIVHTRRGQSPSP
jgi:hypothetical protein